jgi:hypothetical protein
MGLDANGLHEDRPNAITTWTGLKVEPLNIHRDDIQIKDIAHALARLCRYNGHVEHYYSVARHSVLVSEALDGTGYELAGLMHDAAEAYLGDLVRPLKTADTFAAFREADQTLDAAIAARFVLPWPQPAAVLEADRKLLLEGELPYPGGLRWTHDSTPQQDERDFLRRYYELTGIDNGSQSPTKTLLIGLSGYARSGKDTAARVLMEHFRFERVAFADNLRDVLYALNPVAVWEAVYDEFGVVDGEARRVQDIVDSIGWDQAKIVYPEIRELLQRLGTEAGRKVLGENVWVDAAMRDLNPAKRYVFTDVRHPNEYDAIKAAGGEVWRITRPGVAPVNQHPSETALDTHHFDRVVVNSTSIQAFDRAVHTAAAGLFLKR